MSNVVAITRREVRGYFDSPVAYIVIVAFLLVAGWMVFGSLFLMDRADLRGFFAPSPFSPSMLLVILVPAVTMRLIAEERKTGTIELITTMPVTDSEVVLGKFIASLCLLGAALLLTVLYPITVSMIGPLDWGPVIAGYVGLLLFSSALLGVGLACSAASENQIVAFIVGFLVCAVLYFIYWLQLFVPDFLSPIVQFVSVSAHLDNMARGVVDSRDVVYYLSATIGGLYLAVRLLARQHA